MENKKISEINSATKSEYLGPCKICGFDLSQLLSSYKKNAVNYCPICGTKVEKN